GGIDDQPRAPATREAVPGKPGRARRKRASAAAAS
ncbi:LysR family transcriptional regulator, partial [Burkholderia sp. Ap-962]|nr:LysR family transcriptional regulator [Burkholderia sp. Ap-962]